MPFRPFQSDFADHRVVVVPAELDREQRARFVRKLSAAVQQQAELATRCNAVLRVSGELREQGDRIVIPHEPAAVVDPEVVDSERDRPEIGAIWWLSWSVTWALEAAGPGAPHGGITLAALYQDELGQAKLGDFGLAPVFEAVCGIETRGQLHCDGLVRAAEGSGRCSGVWSLLGDDDVRETGWLAPYFAHELFEGKLRLNPKADQFAAGTLLYLLGTGAHPYGASLGDPTLMTYFHLEPFAVADERTEWAEIFERAAGGVSTSADKPILAWSEFVHKLLASDPGERFASPAAAAAAANELCPPAWGQAAEAAAAGLGRLEAGDVGGLLERVAPWRTDEALPEPWREQLARWLPGIEARKDEIGARKRLEQRLTEGQQALNGVELERAREIAREVLAAPQCDEELHAAAEELVELCDEQEQFIQSGADDLAKAYLESAGECLERNDFDHAREILNGLLHDPATPGARAGQARRLLAEAELTEQRIEQQQAELAGAGEDLQAGRYDAARQRLEALLKESSLAEPDVTQARTLLDQVAQAQVRRAAYVAALEAARNAWERADPETLEQRLAEVPADLTDPEIADVRADLASRGGALRAALDKRSAAQAALEAGDAQAGLAHAVSANELGEIPQILQDELDELARQCRQRVDQREQMRVEQVSGLLAAARKACEALNVDECRRRLEQDVLSQTDLPEHIVREASDLQQTCERVERALALLDRASTHLADGKLDHATELLDRLEEEGLPAALLERRNALRDDLVRAREERQRQERRRLAELLGEIERGIEAGELEQADATLQPIEASPNLDDELRRRVAAARALLRQQQPILETLNAAESAVADGAADLPAVLKTLDKLPPELLQWAAARVATVRQRADELAQRQQREAAERTTAALDAAETALDAGDVAGAREHLEMARAGLELDGSLAERHGTLAALAGRIEQWLPKLRAVSEVVEAGELAAAQRELAGLLAAEEIPESCRTSLVELSDRVATDIARRRAELDAELATLASELLDRGLRARKFQQRIEAINADGLATERQRARAAELWEQWQRLERPKRSNAPYVAAASVAALAVVAAGLYFGGVFGGGDAEPIVPAAANAALPIAKDDSADASDATDEAVVVAEPGAGEASESEPPPELEPPAEQVVTPELEPESEAVVQTEAVQTESEPEPPPEPEPARPTVEQLAPEYVAALQQALPGVAIAGELLPADGGLYEVRAEWNGRALLSFAGVELDEQAGRLAPAIDEPAEHFRLQIAALELLDQPVDVAIPLGDADAEPYQARLRFISPEQAAIGEVDLAAQRVRVRGSARLEGDSRAGAGFAFAADATGAALEIDDATRSAFAGYLAELQADRLREAAAAIARELELAEGLRLTGPDGFDGGRRVPLTVRGAGDRALAETEAEWNSEALRYEIDPADALARIRAGLREVAAGEATRPILSEAWSGIRASLIGTEVKDETRTTYLERCELVAVDLPDVELREPLAVAVEVVVGPPQDNRLIRFPGRLSLRNGELTWDPSGTERARAVVLAQLPAPAPRTLDEKLAELASDPTAAPAAFYDVLTNVTLAKIERYGTTRYELAEGLASAADPLAGLVAVSAGLQRLTAPNRDTDAFAVVFVEYYVGEHDVYALGWQAETGAADAIGGVSDTKVWRVMSAADLRGYASPAAFRKVYADDADFGERLLGRAFGDVLAGSAGGSFGVMIAPDGPLWLTRWEQVRFAPRPVRNLEQRATPRLESASSLREILRPARAGERDTDWRRAGLWCVPALAGEWRGPTDQIDDFQLGELVSGKKPQAAHFKQWGALTFAAITDPTAVGDWGWTQFARDLTLDQIGHVFWDRRWSGERWDASPLASFALIQTP